MENILDEQQALIVESTMMPIKKAMNPGEGTEPNEQCKNCCDKCDGCEF
jgi:hypothetical protein